MEQHFVPDVPLPVLRDFLWGLIDNGRAGWNPERARKLMLLVENADDPFICGTRDRYGYWLRMSGGYRVQAQPVQLFDIAA